MVLYGSTLAPIFMPKYPYLGGTVPGRASDADLQQLVQQNLHLEVTATPTGFVVRQKPRGSRRFRKNGAGLAASEFHGDTIAGRLSVDDLYPELKWMKT